MTLPELAIAATLLLLVTQVTVSPAGSIEPAQVKGSLRVGEESIPLTRVYAHLHDNAEGVLARPKELRIAFVDRELPPGLLQGTAFLPLEDLAMEGGVRGLLLQLDPGKPNAMVATLLEKPEQPGAFLQTQTLSSGGPELWKDFHWDLAKVRGTIEQTDEQGQSGGDFLEMSFAIEFIAPVSHEPAVTLDLTGPKAQESAPVMALRARAAAVKAGDLAAVKRIVGARSLKRMESYLALTGMSEQRMVQMMQQGVAEQEAALDRLERVVIRGESAVVIYSTGNGAHWTSLSLVDGAWKPED